MSASGSPSTPSDPSLTEHRDDDHYFNATPSTPSKRRTVPLVLPDLQLDLLTDRGVFARDGVDPGSKLLLLDGPKPTPGDTHIADVGAGYGPIAITLAIRNPQATIWAVDVNQRARDLCRDNAAAAGLDNIEVIAPEDMPADVMLDRVWSNPPIRVGKHELHALLETWLSRLHPGSGTGHLVVQKHLGSDSLQRWLNDHRWATTRRASRGGYRLLDVTARPAIRPAADLPPET